MTLDLWESPTPEKFSAYHMSALYIFLEGNWAPTPPVKSMVIGHPAVNNFKNGIRRDPTVSTTLKDNHRFEQWNLHRKATAHAQDMGDILDKNYTIVQPKD